MDLFFLSLSWPLGRTRGGLGVSFVLDLWLLCAGSGLVCLCSELAQDRKEKREKEAESRQSRSGGEESAQGR